MYSIIFLSEKLYNSVCGGHTLIVQKIKPCGAHLFYSDHGSKNTVSRLGQYTGSYQPSQWGFNAYPRQASQDPILFITQV